MPRKRKVSEPVNVVKPKQVQNVASQDEMSVLKVIVNAQRSDADSKKCYGELQKLYEKVSKYY
jgi:hypothetical protein